MKSIKKQAVTHRNYTLVSAILFGLVALLHLVRVLVTQTTVTVDLVAVPLSASWLALALSAGLSVWGFFSFKSL